MYPPEPWDLRGQLYLSVFAVPRTDLPPLPQALASVVRPVPLGRRTLVGAAWVRYEPGGTLHYQELLSAVLVHERGRPRVSIVDIWVDSLASRDGGRALWGIPKDLAELDLRVGPDSSVAATAATGVLPGTAEDLRRGPAGPIASAMITRGVRLPGRWPTAMSVAQAQDGRVRRTAVRGRAGLRLGGATWQVEPGGPLGYLHGRRPLVTATLADFRLCFGAPAPAPAATHG